MPGLFKPCADKKEGQADKRIKQKTTELDSIFSRLGQLFAATEGDLPVLLDPHNGLSSDLLDGVAKLTL